MAEHIGNYEILRKLAAGGMAEVFLAKQTSLGGFERLVCIKRILPHLTEQDDFISMFQDEARIAANLTHPNVAQIYDIGEAAGAYYIAMEYVRGEDLRRVYNAEVSRGRAMPVEPAAQITMYAAAGLDYAHRQTTIDGRPLGIVHRDISPQNILVTYDGHVKIVDFGVAKAANKMTETRSGVLKGKYSYMSPEQASGDPIDSRTDIFALAITLYEITTGTRLFKRENELETLHAVIECDITPPGDVIPGYDSDLEAIVLRALSYDPDDRYSSAGDLERDLERFLVSRNHPTGPSSLGAYMQDLFAEKLADELLFGGQPWEENNTPSKPQATRRVASKPSRGSKRSNAERRSAADGNAETTELSPPLGEEEEATQIDGGWAKAEAEPDLWGRAAAEHSWGMGSQSVSMTLTHGKDVEPPPRRQATTGSVSHNPRQSSSERRTPRRRRAPRWFTSLALGALLIGFGAGLALIMTSERGGARGPRSGPLTVDSEPRGARVEFIGLGADAINARYSGHRTPFKIPEGFRVDVPMRARFVKDGFEIAEIDLPQLEVGVVPRPLYVELPPGEEGAEAGSLMLLSTPPGAQVWVNGNRQTGTTPLTDVRVRGGEIHRVEFRKAGYKPRWETRYVEPASRIFIEVNLFPEDDRPHAPVALETPPVTVVPPKKSGASEKKSGDSLVEPPPKSGGRKAAGKRGSRAQLSVTAPMKLRITIDSRVVGETPVRKIAVEPGNHTIRAYSVAGGFTVIRKIRIGSGRSETIDLRPRKGNLAMNATPWAWVRIGKESPAETPVRLEVYEGEYSVVFECPDGKRKRRPAKVVPGQTATVTINCRK